MSAAPRASLIRFEAIVEATKHGRFQPRLRGGNRLRSSGGRGPHPFGLHGQVELSPHPHSGRRVITTS